MYTLPKTKEEALQLVAQNQFQPFDQLDWATFSGCESDNPLICYLSDPDTKDGDASGIAIVIDGLVLYFQSLNDPDETGWKTFSVVEE